MTAFRFAVAAWWLFAVPDPRSPAIAAPISRSDVSTRTLAQKLAATSVRQPGAKVLSDWLSPIADNVVLTVCVIATPAPPIVLVPQQTPSFSVAEFLNRSNALGRTDADFFFWGNLTPTSRETLRSTYVPKIRDLQRSGRLPARWDYSTATMHFEAVAYGRDQDNPARVIFPGWAAHEIRFDDAPLTVSCAAAPQRDRCQPALANGMLLTGRQVEVTGALVADCHDQTCSRLLELHPIYAMRTAGPCAPRKNVMLATMIRR